MHSAAMRVRHAMAFATHKFFNDRGFLYIHTPIVTGADCEGAGEQFAVSTLLPDPHAGGAAEGPPITATGAVDYSKVWCACSLNKRGTQGRKGGVKICTLVMWVEVVTGVVIVSAAFWVPRK